MEIIEEKEILGKILLPLNSEWEVSGVETDESKEEIFVRLRYKVDFIENEEYYYLSIDEKAVRKGHEYISILSDEQTGIVIEVVAGRDMESAKKLCKYMNNNQIEKVKTVCTDM